ncbi:hypothetical protein HA402_009533 [Bradysia odoriphaga]|nr:hypothetical protein HA402_009533 [Bradysia odoriphaga]
MKISLKMRMFMLTYISDMVRDMNHFMDSLDPLIELLNLERHVDHVEDEPNTIDHIMELRAKFFQPTPREEIDARIAPLLANAPKPNITERDTTDDGYDDFWGDFFDGISDDESSFVQPDDRSDIHIPPGGGGGSGIRNGHHGEDGNRSGDDRGNRSGDDRGNQGGNNDGNGEDGNRSGENGEGGNRSGENGEDGNRSGDDRGNRGGNNGGNQNGDNREHRGGGNRGNRSGDNGGSERESDGHVELPGDNNDDSLPVVHESIINTPNQDQDQSGNTTTYRNFNRTDRTVRTGPISSTDSGEEDDGPREENGGPRVNGGPGAVNGRTAGRNVRPGGGNGRPGGVNGGPIIIRERRPIITGIIVRPRDDIEFESLRRVYNPHSPPPPRSPRGQQPTAPPLPPRRQRPPLTSLSSPETPHVEEILPFPNFFDEGEESNVFHGTNTGGVTVPNVTPGVTAPNVTTVTTRVTAPDLTTDVTAPDLTTDVTAREFDEVREAQVLIMNVLNRVPTAQFFRRRTSDHSNEAFMLFSNMWCLKIFSVEIDEGDGNYVVFFA